MTTPSPDWTPAGLIPASLLPFSEDYAIDERCAANHLRRLGGVRGASAITVNGHASEVSACTFDEQRRILDLALDEIGSKVPIICGVYSLTARWRLRASRGQRSRPVRRPCSCFRSRRW
ncbi:dihydrodipicolinate synthase family protein [Paraburkholderia sp. BR13439]|uniref:dihydrodipicolinate synthase family protein n=1 Tax=Paraburkholderia TaxID=1822464 RepID=UPI0034CD4C22